MKYGATCCVESVAFSRLNSLERMFRIGSSPICARRENGVKLLIISKRKTGFVIWRIDNQNTSPVQRAKKVLRFLRIEVTINPELCPEPAEYELFVQTQIAPNWKIIVLPEALTYVNYIYE
jgi:hypothetical protein